MKLLMICSGRVAGGSCAGLCSAMGSASASSAAIGFASSFHSTASSMMCGGSKSGSSWAASASPVRKTVIRRRAQEPASEEEVAPFWSIDDHLENATRVPWTSPRRPIDACCGQRTCFKQFMEGFSRSSKVFPIARRGLGIQGQTATEVLRRHACESWPGRLHV